jgi:transcriptional antiterminator RfaH
MSEDATDTMQQQVPLPILQKTIAQFAVVNTQAHKEASVVEHLLRQGYVPYCPKMLRRITHARRVREVLRPLFPGYLFVAMDPSIQEWAPITSTYGVRRLVKAGDRPALLDGALIDALKARELDGAIIRPPNPYEVGDHVRFVGNAFEGVVAQIVELKDADRVIVLLELLQRSVRMTANVRSVRPAAQPD